MVTNSKWEEKIKLQNPSKFLAVLTTSTFLLSIQPQPWLLAESAASGWRGLDQINPGVGANEVKIENIQPLPIGKPEIDGGGVNEKLRDGQPTPDQGSGDVGGCRPPMMCASKLPAGNPIQKTPPTEGGGIGPIGVDPIGDHAWPKTDTPPNNGDVNILPLPGEGAPTLPIVSPPSGWIGIPPGEGPGRPTSDVDLNLY